MNRRERGYGTFECMSLRVGQAWPMMTDVQQQYVVRMHGHYVDEFRRLGRELPDEQPSIAASIHAAVDECLALTMAQDERSRDITCRKGCAHCCHLNVTITRPEALLLLAYAEEQGIELDRAKLERQAATNDDPMAWVHQSDEDRACAFLDPATSLCRVYEHRPDACRKHLTVSDPSMCDSKNNPDAKPAYFVSMEAEITASAAMTAFDAGNMPAMLLRYATWPR